MTRRTATHLALAALAFFFSLALLAGVPAGPEPAAAREDQPLGQSGGAETITLVGSEAPAHSHAVRVNTSSGNLPAPAPNEILGSSLKVAVYQDNPGANLIPMATDALSPAGGGQPHPNMQPYLTLNFCIALRGIFPPRS